MKRENGKYDPIFRYIVGMKNLPRYYFMHIRMFNKNARLFLLSGFLSGLGLAVFGLLFNLYLKETGFSESQIGQVLSFGALGSAIMAIPAAMILERFPLKKILIWSTLLAVLSYFLVVFSVLLSMISLFFLFANMFVIVYRVSTSPFLMNNSNKRERIFLFSFNSALTMFAQSIGFLLGGFLPKIILMAKITSSLHVAYQLSLYLSVVGVLISLIPYLGLTQAPIIRKHISFIRSFKQYDWRLLSRLIIPRLLLGLGAGLVIPFMNLYFKNVFKADSTSIGIFFSVLQIFMVIGYLITPLLSKRFGMLNTIVYTQLLSVPFMFFLAISKNLQLSVVAFIVRGTLMNLNTPVISNFEMELVSKSDRPFTNALSTLTWQGSFTISSWLGGHIIERYSFAWSFYVTIFFYLISAATYYTFFKNKTSVNGLIKRK